LERYDSLDIGTNDGLFIELNMVAIPSMRLGANKFLSSNKDMHMAST